MGAMRSAVKRKTHKERSQPLARRNLGLLEKKKDYRLRARDFHKKEKTLQILRKKAEERNPDEFYFSMEKQKLKDGVHVKESTEANKYSHEELLLMKTQDVKYVALKAQTEAKKIERLQQRLHLVGAPSQAKHTIFVDDQAQLRGFSATEHFQTPEELLQRSYNRPRREQLESSGAAPAGINKAEAARLDRYKAAAYRELADRTERQRKLQGLAEHMTRKKELMSGGNVKKLEPEAPGKRPTYKWKLERKK